MYNIFVYICNIKTCYPINEIIDWFIALPYSKSNNDNDNISAGNTFANQKYIFSSLDWQLTLVSVTT